MSRKKEMATVLSQEMLAEGIFSLWLETSAAAEAKPGQFLLEDWKVRYAPKTPEEALDDRFDFYLLRISDSVSRKSWDRLSWLSLWHWPAPGVRMIT